MNGFPSWLRQVSAPLVFSALWFGVAGFCRGEGTKFGDDAWQLELSAGQQTFRVRPDGSGWSEAARVARRGELSPDGKHLVYVDVPEENRPRSNGEIFVADSDGANARRLTKGEAEHNWPAWTPDGKRIVFGSNRSGVWQVYAMDAAGRNIEPLTDEAVGAERPEVAADGRLAYLAQRKRQGKVWYADLIVRDGDDSNPIAQNAWLYADHAWSPDAKHLAYGKIGGLVFHDFATVKEWEIDFARDIDPEMDSHAAWNFAWRPDGEALACSIAFCGGRQAGGPTMIGDEEVFIIPREGKPTWFKMQLPRISVLDKPSPQMPTSITWVPQKQSLPAGPGN